MRRSQMQRSFCLRALSLAVTVCFMAGCSFLAPRFEDIGVSSNPQGAQVIVNGKSMGATPVHFKVHSGDKNVLLEVQKSGYQPQYRTMSRRMSTIGILDVV